MHANQTPRTPVSSTQHPALRPDQTRSDQTRPNHLILLRGHTHIRINSSTECRKTRTPSHSSLRPGIGPKNPPGDTPRRDAVGEVVLRAQTLNAALRARVQCTHDPEVLGGRPRSSSHVFKAVAKLLAPGEVGNLAALGGEAGVVGHLYRSVSVPGSLSLCVCVSCLKKVTYTSHE